MMNKTIKTILISGFFLCTIPVMAQEEFPDMQPPFPQQEEGKAPFKEIPNPEKSAKQITEEMAKELEKARQKKEKKLKKILTDEQYTRWQEIQLKRKDEPGKPPVPPEEK